MSATTEHAPIGASFRALLRAAYPGRHAAKRAALAAETSPDTARAWISGRKEPSVSILLRMAARCDAFADAMESALAAERAARRPVPNRPDHRANGGASAPLAGSEAEALTP